VSKIYLPACPLPNCFVRNKGGGERIKDDKNNQVRYSTVPVNTQLSKFGHNFKKPTLKTDSLAQLRHLVVTFLMPYFDTFKKYLKQSRKILFKSIIIMRLNLDASFLL
jgi:hypothetical protein